MGRWRRECKQTHRRQESFWLPRQEETANLVYGGGGDECRVGDEYGGGANEDGDRSDMMRTGNRMGRVHSR
jgi:hypothetical protein